MLSYMICRISVFCKPFRFLDKVPADWVLLQNMRVSIDEKRDTYRTVVSSIPFVKQYADLLSYFGWSEHAKTAVENVFEMKPQQIDLHSSNQSTSAVTSKESCNNELSKKKPSQFQTESAWMLVAAATTLAATSIVAYSMTNK